MTQRALPAVNGRLASWQRQIHAWGRTSGGGSPTLDTPSYGTSSITDVNTGTLDVTMERTPAPTPEAILAITASTNATMTGCEISSTAAVGATFRLCSVGSATSTTDPALGYQWIVGGL